MLRVKTLHSEVLRCRADAGRSEGAGAAQVAVASGPSARFQARACAHELGACARGPWAGRASGMFQEQLHLCHLLREGTAEAEAWARGRSVARGCHPSEPPWAPLPVVCLPLRVEFI